MGTFKAWVVEKTEGGQTLAFRDFDDADLMDGDVTVRVTHSTVNYKDGLAMTGRSPVVRRFPMIPGIDFSGVVETSDHPDYRPGDAVVHTGWGVGETHLGAYAERARVKGDWLVPLPAGLSPEQAMAVGTAGYTAMLSLMALDAHGVTPAHGPALVTGASGGVGSVAVALLARAGWHVIASTGRAGEADYLKGLGAAEILDRAELAKPGRPLGKERWAAAVDAVGSVTLANVLAMTKADGAVAACGLAQGMDLPTSVAPFILRGVSLLGINSVTTPQSKRREAWARLARELDLEKLAAMTSRIRLEEVGRLGEAILDGKVRGRTVVEVA
ncbi:MDR family oxidoreductase [Methylobacterium sp. NEAU 140]|uniref:acrylyl-CoA reductase (NADPH) n=1 Tax=Methylobacterium sp. NEAU 140 TaxID=3064945 RepID=UPI002733C01C|nr:MDR family oxidoreductase [Methylobacterium sp. NEAU 140]MDP4024400.1 MDR family oxidoreductase [Methylobacterium sp. NEAU 140]